MECRRENLPMEYLDVFSTVCLVQITSIFALGFCIAIAEFYVIVALTFWIYMLSSKDS